MIQHLKHNEIDKTQWNRCVSSSPDGLIYCLSTYLDAVVPNWEGLVFNDYEAVLPLPVKRKFRIKYLVQPLCTQKFAISGPLVTRSVESKFIDALYQTYLYKNLRLQFKCQTNVLRSFAGEYVNMELGLNKPYQKLWEGFSKNHKKNIRSARNKELNLVHVHELETFNEFIQQNLKHKLSAMPQNVWDVIFCLTRNLYSNNLCDFISVQYAGTHVAMACIAHFNKRRYLLFSSANELGRKKRAVYFMLNALIEEHSGKALVLDFEGSSIPEIAYFFKGFGATETKFYGFRVSKLPWLISGNNL